MKTNLVVWGENAQKEKVLILLDLLPDENKVIINTIPEGLVTEELERKLMDEWRLGNPVELPDGILKIERVLSVSDSILPDELTTERTDIIQRAQTQWHFVVLSSKLNSAYQSELADLQEKVKGLKNFSQDAWDDLKNFWQKVQEQVRDKNLFAEHAGILRESTNHLFTALKDLKSSFEEEVEKASSEILKEFNVSIETIENKINEGNRLQSLFDDLKSIQNSFKDLKFIREHRSQAWEKLDGAFKLLKEKKYGNHPSTGEGSPMVRIQRRYDGLISAVDKMQTSIDRDKADLDVHTQKASSSDRQLETLVAEAKLAMIQDRISSKEEKLAEMLKTKGELESRMNELKHKEVQKEEQEKFELAKKAVQEKIANEIKQASVAREIETAVPDAPVKKEKPAAKAKVATKKVVSPIEKAIETAEAIGSISDTRKD
ncbi:MAG TPA: hypothetical protein VK590_09095 [Saprospiraceae bacterium]|nr:hypothetical protein [Saprospiraceae bacterium]